MSHLWQRKNIIPRWTFIRDAKVNRSLDVFKPYFECSSKPKRPTALILGHVQPVQNEGFQWQPS